MIDCANISLGSYVCRATITYRQDIDPSQGEYNDTGRNDDSPERESDRLLTGSFFVQVAEDIDAENAHSETKEVEAMGVAQNRPIGPKPAFKDGTLGYDEKHLRALGGTARRTVSNILLDIAVRQCVAPSKKKNLTGSALLP